MQTTMQKYLKTAINTTSRTLLQTRQTPGLFLPSRLFAAKIPQNNNLQGLVELYQREGYRVANNVDPTGLNNYHEKK
jgi:hypothetical protein